MSTPEHSTIPRPARPITAGNPASPVWIIGEAPGEVEVETGVPFSGPSGYLLDKVLMETGFTRRDCFLTNVCHERPPGNEISKWFYNKTAAKTNGAPEYHGRYPAKPVVAGVADLHRMLREHQPMFIIALGNTALWALAGEWGILKWRASIMPTSAVEGADDIKMMPTVHPAAVLRQFELRNLLVQDFRRARRESRTATIERPEWQFIIRPNADKVLWWCHDLYRRLESATEPVPFACDIETRARQIACIGIATSKLDAICIPLMDNKQRAGYWSTEEEHLIILSLRKVLTHEKAHCIFQNGAYDLQYFAAQYAFLPRARDDTMLMQHVAFPGMLKGLDFLSSLYCRYHRYWKDDGKEWAFTLDEDKHWVYNCEDCVRTFEVWEVLGDVLRGFGLQGQYRFQMDDVFPIALKMMIRGILVDNERKQRLRVDLEQFIDECNDWLRIVLGHKFNVSSPKQMQTLFYEDFNLPKILKRRADGKFTPSLDDEAMDKIERRNPVLRPLIQVIRDIRSARVTISNVLDASISSDGRARCTYNIAGPETFRFSSSEDAFGDGFNLQNLTKGEEE
jgi:uracil-DNA glycosylase